MQPNGKRLTNQRVKMLKKIKAKNPSLADEMSKFQLDWYRIRNSADGETTDLYIYDEIMPNWLVELFGSGVSAEGLIEELNESTASTLNVRINSPGGDVYEAIAIFNTLVNHPATINVYVDAIAASAASVIAMAGDKITMMVGSQIMIHDAMGIEFGNAAEMRAMADFLDKQSDNIASIYANRAGGEISDWRNLMLAETWMFAQEAVDMGLADEIFVKPKSAEPEGMPEEEEKPEDQEEGEENPDETDEEPTPDEEEELSALMSTKHTLANRGFKYPGRKLAPSPTENQSNFVGSLIDNMFAERK